MGSLGTSANGIGIGVVIVIRNENKTVIEIDMDNVIAGAEIETETGEAARGIGIDVDVHIEREIITAVKLLAVTIVEGETTIQLHLHPGITGVELLHRNRCPVIWPTVGFRTAGRTCILH